MFNNIWCNEAHVIEDILICNYAKESTSHTDGSSYSETQKVVEFHFLCHFPIIEGSTILMQYLWNAVFVKTGFTTTTCQSVVKKYWKGAMTLFARMHSIINHAYGTMKCSYTCISNKILSIVLYHPGQPPAKPNLDQGEIILDFVRS